MIEITGGTKYMDIDAYASCIAYAKLLNSIGVEAKAVTTALANNKSITPTLKNLNYKLEKAETKKDKSIILDICDPSKIDKKILKSHIIEVIDHHPSKTFENYWYLRGISLQIEEIGSICTIIFEKIIAENKVNILDTGLCMLLAAGIIDNTLNLKANITKKRDINAYNKLVGLGNLNEDFAQIYLEECQNTIEGNLRERIKEDLKTNIRIIGLPSHIWQLFIIDINKFLKRKIEIKNIMNEYKKRWIINIISLQEEKSYIISNDQSSLISIKNTIGGYLDDDILILPKFLLRKEIIKAFTT